MARKRIAGPVVPSMGKRRQGKITYKDLSESVKTLVRMANHALLTNRYWTDSGHNAVGYQCPSIGFDSGGAPIIVKNNFVATTDPTINDDGNAGYTIRSMWVNTVTGDVFFLINPDNGFADWVNLCLTPEYLITEDGRLIFTDDGRLLRVK